MPTPPYRDKTTARAMSLCLANKMRCRDVLLHLSPALGAAGVYAQNTARPQPLSRAIASSGEQIPVVGLGSWITFNVGNAPRRDKTFD